MTLGGPASRLRLTNRSCAAMSSIKAYCSYRRFGRSLVVLGMDLSADVLE
jgi:hypothetical protein